MLINFLKDRLLIPNEEMIKLINELLSKGKNENDKEEEKEEMPIENDNKDQDKYIDLEKDSKDILCFMKYCFTEKKMFKSMNLVNVALSEYNVCNIIIKVKQIVIILR